MKALAILAACLLGAASCLGARNTSHIITTPVPERAPGQADVVGLRTAPLDTVRVGFIGLGMRGWGAIDRFPHIEGAKVAAICDKDPGYVARARKRLAKKGVEGVPEYSGEEGWRQLCERPDVDLVYICTDWVNHVPMALYAMDCGKHVAVEVPAAMNLDECWALVDKAEQTRLHCMMLENCVYDFFELTTLNMAQQGLFGDILHVEGSYIHNLEPFWGQYKDNWRLDYNEAHKGDVYATHGMGPAAQLVNLHRGNKMEYLVAMESLPLTGPEIVRRQLGRESADFQNADHTMTMIQTHTGQTMHIQHDVMNPRPYSRMYQLTGTKGYANKYPVEGYCFADANSIEGFADHEKLDMHQCVPDDVREQLAARYRHPIQAETEAKAREVGGHGGMDYIMDYRLVYCLRNGLPLDQDVYDAAEWSCLGELSRISIENCSAPVEVPDFTRGSWQKLPSYHHYMKGE